MHGVSCAGCWCAGNGGIALELVGALRGVLDVVWVLKHGHVGDAFFDTDAAAFLLKQLEEGGGVSKGGVQRQPWHEAVPQRQHKPAQQQPSNHPPPSGQHGPASSASPSRAQDAVRPAGAAPAKPHGSAASPPAPAWGHSAGPKWTQHLQLHRVPQPPSADLPGGPMPGLTLELNALVEQVTSHSQPEVPAQVTSHSQLAAPAQGGDDAGGALQGGSEAWAEHGRAGAEGGGGGCPGPGSTAEDGHWPVYARLTNGKVRAVEDAGLASGGRWRIKVCSFLFLYPCLGQFALEAHESLRLTGPSSCLRYCLSVPSP